MSKRWPSVLLFFAATAAFSTHPTPTAAQAQKANWTPWLGCWQAEGAPDGEYLCIVPDDAGVRMLTVADGAVRADARVLTDGRAHEIVQDGCTGSERANWSSDGRRVFLGSSLTCDGGLQRRASGIFAFASTTEWLSVQTVTIDDRVATRTVRYRAVQPTDLPSEVKAPLRNLLTTAFRARLAVVAAVDEADVSEAATNVDPTAVQEWLDATRQQYQIGDAGESSVVSTSALDLTAGSSFETQHASPGNVRVVERVIERPVPVYVHDHVHVVRRCWDPFAAGYIDMYAGWGWGVAYGAPSCRGLYYSRYSPWGYDLYGWRVVHRPVVIVRNAPIIIRVRDHDYWRNRDYWRDRNWNRDRDWRGDRDRDRNGGRITRDGYRSDRPSDRPAQPGRVVRSVRDETPPRTAKPRDRSESPVTRSAPSSRDVVERPAPSTRDERPARSARDERPAQSTRNERSAAPRDARERASRPSPSSRSAESKAKPVTRTARVRAESR